LRSKVQKSWNYSCVDNNLYGLTVFCGKVMNDDGYCYDNFWRAIASGVVLVQTGPEVGRKRRSGSRNGQRMACGACVCVRHRTVVQTWGGRRSSGGLAASMPVCVTSRVGQIRDLFGGLPWSGERGVWRLAEPFWRESRVHQPGLRTGCTPQGRGCASTISGCRGTLPHLQGSGCSRASGGVESWRQSLYCFYSLCQSLEGCGCPSCVGTIR